MARDKLFEVAKREQPASTNFGNDRTAAFPDQVPERLLGQAELLSGLPVVVQQRSIAIWLLGTHVHPPEVGECRCACPRRRRTGVIKLYHPAGLRASTSKRSDLGRIRPAPIPLRGDNVLVVRGAKPVTNILDWISNSSNEI